MSLLWDAVEDRNIYFVNRLLSQGWSANDQDPVGQTLLDVAISLDEPEVAELLMDAGGLSFFYSTDLEKGAPDLGTVLSSGHIKVARHLLDRGASPNGIAENGFSGRPLVQAIQGLGEKGVENLLEFGADVGIKDKAGRDAAAVAAEAGRLQALALLERDLDCRLSGHWRRPLKGVEVQQAFGAAILQCNWLAIGALLGKVDLLKPVKHGGTALFWAAYAGDIRPVMELAARCPDLQRGDRWGRSPLWAAARYGRAEIVKTLLCIGDVNGWPLSSWGTSKWDGTGPLWNAAEQGHAVVVKMLLQEGAPDSLNTRTREGALSAAVRSGHVETVRVLLDEGASPTGLKGERRPPIYTARLHGHREIFRLLREAGAEADVSLSLKWKDREPVRF